MKVVLVFFFCLLTIGAFAQPGDRYHRNPSFMDFKDSKTKLYGFKNEKGKVVVPAIYSNVGFNPDYGTWGVQKDSLYGLYSSEGKLILNPIYKFIELHPNLYKEFIVVSKDNKYFGLTDLNGKKLLDFKYPKIWDFRNNMLLVYECINDSITNHMIIDTMQNMILDSKVIHANVYGFVENNPYDNDTSIYIMAIQNEKIALFSNNGRQITDYIFKGGQPQSRGNLIQGCIDYTHKQCGVIDKNNKIIVPFKYRFAGIFDNGTIRADTEEGDSFYFDSNGRPITEKEFKILNAKHPYWGTD